MQKCYKCNRQFKDESIRFCPYCGSPLAVDKEWEAAEKQRIAKENAERIAREKAAEEKRKNREMAGPLISHMRELDAELRSIKDRNQYYVPFSGYRWPDLETREGLEQLKKDIQEREDYLSAYNNNGDKNLVDRLLEILKRELDKLNGYYNKFKGYQAYQSEDWKSLKDLLSAFFNGGKITLDHSESNILDNHDALGNITPTEIVPSSLVPNNEVRKLIGYNSSSDYVFRRYKVYKRHGEYFLYLTFPYGGMSSFIRGITYSSKDWGTKYLRALTDIQLFNEFLEKHASSYTWMGLKSKLRDSFIKIKTGELSKKEVGPTYTFDHYEYYASKKY